MILPNSMKNVEALKLPQSTNMYDYNNTFLFSLPFSQRAKVGKQ